MRLETKPDDSVTSDPAVVDQLCLRCGICCDGTLFRDVELQPGDDAAKLQDMGLPLEASRCRRSKDARTSMAGKPKLVSMQNQSLVPSAATVKFPQPCAAFGADCRCRVYADRPARCRTFECALLKSVAAGKVELIAALRTIRTGRKRADNVRKLLRELGDTDEQRALSLRFKRMKRRLESGGLDDETADLFSQLTLAVHDLNFLLRESFYP